MGLVARKFGLDERFDVDLQNVALDDLQVAEMPHGLLQDRKQPVVELHGRDLSGPLAKMLG
ncbi:hypothetical protein SDC9_203312 [bioreactor metagenome]|uniref:Uncharacterized protein n=1 Tax=bioreactor metagenome TaxID=1076179 RepID=A0A645IW38_9ZZZZ